MSVEFKTLQDGTSIVVRFVRNLSPLYAEPRGQAFLSDQRTQILDGDSEFFEAYGYDPHRPGDTPIPFWGDHYIKPVSAGSPPTLWRVVKERVNREAFLPRVGNRFVDAVLAVSRTQKLGKFLCREYHRHLVKAYEAVWAITDAMRRYYSGAPASRWKVTPTNCSEIITMAAAEAKIVSTAPYKTLGFIQLIQRLELKGLSPHYQPIRDRLQSVAAEMFEVVTSEYVRTHSGFNVRRSVSIPFLNAEVDMYATRNLGTEDELVIGSNKLRITSAHAIRMSEIENLSKRLEAARKHEQAHASSIGHSLSVSGAFFTNTVDMPEDVGRRAEKCKIEIFAVKISPHWLEHPIRRHLKKSDIKFLGGFRRGPMRYRLASGHDRGQTTNQEAVS